MKTKIFATLALLAIGSLSAQAGPGRQGGMMWKMLDTNSDGRIDKNEWSAHFAAIDADKNGNLDAAEIRNHHRKNRPGMGMGPGANRTPRMLSLLDTDKNAKISRDEWDTHFKAMDKNKDGALNPAEFAAHRKAMMGG